jgi:hypothetical protein
MDEAYVTWGSEDMSYLAAHRAIVGPIMTVEGEFPMLKLRHSERRRDRDPNWHTITLPRQSVYFALADRPEEMREWLTFRHEVNAVERARKVFQIPDRNSLAVEWPNSSS